MTADALDLAGIGIGPFNLSLAAQLDSAPAVSARFFDRRMEFAWHPGMMLFGVEMQTSILKDLVTATNPTSPWSFISYLVAHRRFYQFLNAEYEAVPRREFADYLGWVARGLPSLTFGAAVEEVRAMDRGFSLRVGEETVPARNLSIGVGKVPGLPGWAEALPETMAFHSSDAVRRLRDLRSGRVAVRGSSGPSAQASGDSTAHHEEHGDGGRRRSGCAVAAGFLAAQIGCDRAGALPVTHGKKPGDGPCPTDETRARDFRGR